MPKYLTFLLVLLLLLSSFPSKHPLFAITDNNSDYASDIDKFMSAGTDIYLAWQFSGDSANPFENDKYSFFQNGPTCKVLKEAAAKYPGKIGVNIFNFHHRYLPSSMDGRSINAVDLNYLKNECGTSVIRFFGTDDPGAVVGAVQALQGAGMKAVIALHNFAIGGQLSFFDPGNYTSARDNAIAVANGVKGLTGSIYTLELSNEPHCGNDGSCVEKYRAWVIDMVSAIRSTGYAGDISIGQASQVARNSRGDSVKENLPDKPVDFEYTNSVSGITKTSGHHYDIGSVTENLAAADLSHTKLNKPFYIGEAALAPEKDEISPPVFKVMPASNNPAGENNCKNLTAADSGSGPFWLSWFNPTAANNLKCYLPNANVNKGTAFIDPCDQAGFTTAIPKEDRAKWINPPNTILYQVNSVISTGHTIAADGHIGDNFDGYPGPDYGSYSNGSWDAATTKNPAKTPSAVDKSVTDFYAGPVVRTVPYFDINDQTVDDWLCRLAASNTTKACIHDKTYQLADYSLGFLGEATNKTYDKSLPGAATVFKRSNHQFPR